jgi:hypothetical protein
MKNYVMKIEVEGMLYYVVEKAFTLKGAIKKAERKIRKGLKKNVQV